MAANFGKMIWLLPWEIGKALSFCAQWLQINFLASTVAKPMD
jgi:hypothetical protein